MNEHVGLSRRSFLAGSAAIGTGLAIGVFLNPSSGEVRVAKAGDEGVKLDWDPQAFVRIAADGQVTVMSKYTELGQGVYTGIATIVAEELDASWEQMQVESAPVNTELYMNFVMGSQSTGGSSSIRDAFAQMRQVGAAARQMLVYAAADAWEVPADAIKVVDGAIQHDASGRSATFGEFAERAAAAPVPETVLLKPVDSYRFRDQKLLRVDLPGKINGRAQFTQDFSLPGMLVAVVAHAPRFGSSVGSFDDSEARQMSGVVDVLRIPSGIAVIADNFWNAQQARNRLSIEWNEENAFTLGSAEILQQFRTVADSDGLLARDDGSIVAGFAAASQTLEAEYTYPYLAHTAMEPLDYVVRWSGDRCYIYAGTQDQTTDQNSASEIFDLAPEKIEIKTLLAGGGFGRRGCQDFSTEAMQIARAFGPRDIPIKLMWTREDDMRSGMYRPLNYHRVRAGIGADGKITAWAHSLVGQSIAAQMAPNWLVDGLDQMSVDGADTLLYALPNVRVESHSPELPIPILWYRGVGQTHAVYTVETFLDQLATLAGNEPLNYRLDMLQHEPRMAAVLQLAADRSNWGAAMGSGRGRGIAMCKARDSYIAQVAEVTVDDDQSFKVDRVVTAMDCGQVINADIVRAQIEGGVGFGLSAVLADEITLRDGYVQQSNFDSYPTLRIDQMPDVEAHLISSDESPSGVGEVTTMCVAPAVANALHAVTGNHYYSLPIRQA